ncbi:hypothetical protein N7462_002811 [Penicillium macrosclerotiorum]|uniref:uncharacterized protein n=1 Tax=Penicillium macrosclerotiorum TaxID=303699 RepID=UPI0025498AFF|nr:uncharacterized protein N7462_002811 [Penicillium macrosclerotiorum]KAJ5693388.1 hypothetical protein N7462_002811 [Penicillium macrosclerotiorum]
MASINPDHTIAYKRVGSLEIPMDIYLPKDKKNAPVLLWFHGGGLLQGRRDLLAPHMRTGVQTYGFVCISADYRLAPQVNVGEVFEDVKDCIRFIREELSGVLGEGLVDGSRLAVSGSSAGGFLSLLAGLYIEPKPQVIIPIYPITDPPRDPAPKGRYTASKGEMAPYLDTQAAVVASSGKLPDDPRSNIYVYMLRAANLAELWGISGNENAAAPYRISRRIHDYGLPPAYILHGDADSAVGVEQSDEVAGAMMGCGLTVQYERPHGEDHFLDNEDGYENKALYEFMLRYL